MKKRHFVNALKLGCIAVSLLGISTTVVSAQEKTSEKQKASDKSTGFILSDDATEQDLGLPMYPGSKPYKEDGQDTSGLHMGL
jgi:hypothetical protein